MAHICITPISQGCCFFPPPGVWCLSSFLYLWTSPNPFMRLPISERQLKPHHSSTVSRAIVHMSFLLCNVWMLLFLAYILRGRRDGSLTTSITEFHELNGFILNIGSFLFRHWPGAGSCTEHYTLPGDGALLQTSDLLLSPAQHSWLSLPLGKFILRSSVFIVLSFFELPFPCPFTKTDILGGTFYH